ncbi:MAG: PASTA domain-containing protein [Clostridia bacterium]|nr:PASTA domain-containing protein [Clostridia bacterium]
MFNTDRLCPGCMNDNGGEKICPVCGCDSSSQNPQDYLPVGFLLNNRYSVGLVKSHNGTETVYIGWDNSKNTSVKIKEYFPVGFCERKDGGAISMLKGGEYTFNEGLMEFLDINRFIINSELPSLMPVTDAFEENGSVYAVMQNIPCITMREFLNRNGGILKWEQARPLFLPLIDTVKGMNDAGIVHGGISNETVLVGRDGKLRISGYGIRKFRCADSELESEVFPGFAAAEQYDSSRLHMDSYTDVYGLCAVLFNVLIGTVPPEAALRLKNDSMSIPAKFAEELPRHVLSALANGLQVMPENRTKNIESFKDELVYAETASDKKTEKSGGAKADNHNSKNPKKKSGGTAKYVVISSACTAAVFLVAAVLIFTVFKKDIFGKDNSSGQSVSASEEAPSVDSIGSVDSGAAVSDVLFPVPQLTGKYYAELVDNAENDEYEKFQFVIKGKEYSDKFARGQICAQSLAEGTNVVRDTKIELTISLGPKEIKIANVVGLDVTGAKIELLKQGFLYDNIEVLEKYDEDREPGTVIEQEPKYGTQISAEAPVKIYINSYGGTDNASSASE